MACHECDFLHSLPPLPVGSVARCARCGTLLAKGENNSVERTLAFTIAALILFIIANIYPILGLHAAGKEQYYTLLSGALVLARFDLWAVGGVVFLTTILFPLLHILGLLYVLIFIRAGRRPPYFVPAFKVALALMPWSMVGVYMLGVLVSIVKLADLATVIPGMGLYALVALLLVTVAASANLNPRSIWQLGDRAAMSRANNKPSGSSARRAGLASCHVCHLVVKKGSVAGYCPRCQTPVHSRKVDSLNRTWALVITAIILYIPANLYPVMTVSKFGQGEPSTIVSGVMHLIHSGMWPLAMIVFIASIIVPVGKLVVLVYLLLSVQYRSLYHPHDRTRLYRILELFGHWSMVDVFLISILVALVDMGFLATIEPGIGVLYFGAVVIITLFASRAFDPRLIWDVIDDNTG